MQFNPYTLIEAAATHLAHLIICGDLKPGETLKERETARTLGISSNTLREVFILIKNKY